VRVVKGPGRRAQAVYSAFARFREQHSLPRVPQYDRAHTLQRLSAGHIGPLQEAPPGPYGPGGGIPVGRGSCGRIAEEDEDEEAGEGSWPGTREAADAHEARRARARAAAAGAPPRRRRAAGLPGRARPQGGGGPLVAALGGRLGRCLTVRPAACLQTSEV
jgi:hypothetical protein